MERRRQPSRRAFLQTALGALALEEAIVAYGEGSGQTPRPSSDVTRLSALPEFLRPDPFGGIVAPDQTGAEQNTEVAKWRHAVNLQAVRNGYASFHLVAEVPQGHSYEVRVSLDHPDNGIKIDAYREWFHFVDSDSHYYPDALIPITLPYSSTLPDPGSRIEKQTAASFWIDVWVPASTPPGVYHAKAVLSDGHSRRSLPIRIKVLPVTIPREDALSIDHNTYSAGWVSTYFPRLAKRGGRSFCKSDELFRMLQSYHRIFYEHRGTFHDLGYGHAGGEDPGFAPVLAGSGRSKHIASWELFDRHYGPLFDGSAFSDTRRGPRPIPSVYLPINPNWPASYLWWGEPGYETEFVNVVSAMEKHFREKGWTHTRFEVFFNQKKRYRGFSWDGDETVYPEEVHYFFEYDRLLKKALPADSPVDFAFRMDTSWRMGRDFDRLKDVIKFWVCNGEIISWYPHLPEQLKQNGDSVWYYTHLPPITRKASAITFWPLRGWIYGVEGLEYWQTIEASRDPWFHSNGEGLAVVYSGERFGIEGPIPSVRLKIQRNEAQDLALLHQLEGRIPLEQLKAEVTRRYNGTQPGDWWFPRPAMMEESHTHWKGSGIRRAAGIPMARLRSKIRPDSWQSVREYVWSLAREEK